VWSTICCDFFTSPRSAVLQCRPLSAIQFLWAFEPFRSRRRTLFACIEQAPPAACNAADEERLLVFCAAGGICFALFPEAPRIDLTGIALFSTSRFIRVIWRFRLPFFGPLFVSKRADNPDWFFPRSLRSDCALHTLLAASLWTSSLLPFFSRGRSWYFSPLRRPPA